MAKETPAPPHYRSISLQNFRGFRRLIDVPLAPLTFLVGPNSSGKSSVFDALLLIAQSEFGPLNWGVTRPAWAGPIVDLGSYRDAVFKHNTRLPITICVGVANLREVYRSYANKPNIQDGEFEFTLRAPPKDPIGLLVKTKLTEPRSGKSFSLSTSARKPQSLLLEAGGQNKTLDTSSSDSTKAGDIERDLDSAIRKLLERRLKADSAFGAKASWRRVLALALDYTFAGFCGETERVASGRGAPKRWYPVQVTSRKCDFWKFRAQTNLFDRVDPSILAPAQDYWLPAPRRSRRKRRQMADILADLDIASQVTESDLSPYHSSIHLTDSATKIVSNLIDVGYGASQVMPVIHGCLSEARGPLLVEQPEIHLHPKAQAILAKLLCTTSSERQVMVETHSEHMINRARIMIADGELRPENVVINYVWRDKRGSHVQTIGLDAHGNFTAEWPGGFFDERFQDTMRLAELRSETSGG